MQLNTEGILQAIGQAGVALLTEKRITPADRPQQLTVDVITRHPDLPYTFTMCIAFTNITFPKNACNMLAEIASCDAIGYQGSRFTVAIKAGGKEGCKVKVQHFVPGLNN